MSQCAMFIAFAKIPAGKRCDFSWSEIIVSDPPQKPHPPMIKSPTKNKN